MLRGAQPNPDSDFEPNVGTDSSTDTRADTPRADRRVLRVRQPEGERLLRRL